MTTTVLLVVLLSAITHAGWNIVAKGSAGDPLTRSAGIAIGAAVVSLPFLAMFGLPARESWWFVCGSAGIHVAYALLVGASYRTADLSAIYPIIRGSALIMSALMAAILLGDVLPGLAWIGVALVSLGVIAMAAEGIRKKGLSRTSLLVAAACAASVTSYTLVDGMGVRLSGNPFGYVTAMLALAGIAILPFAFALRGNALGDVSWPDWGRNIAGGAMMTASYAAALWAFTQAPIGLVGAVRETSVLWGAAFAALLLGEKFGAWRWIAAVAIVLGLVVTRLAR